MESDRFLEILLRSTQYRDQIVHVENFPGRPARFGRLHEPLPPPLLSALEGLEIRELYSHQALCIDEARAGHNVAIITSTASGKTLCYTLPVLERLLKKPGATALFVYPTKALAQDQLRGLLRIADLSPRIHDLLRTGTYDGDTPRSSRRRIREQANIILTNPDMLHAGILPYHSRWSRVLENLEFVVLDEIHAYRGIFGSNVANVIRRLRRICRHHGSNPRFLLCSATIANPGEFARGLIGEEVTLIDEDGSPRGPRKFVLWNPPVSDSSDFARRSSNVEAHILFTELIKERIQTICFSKARVVAELIHRYTLDALTRERPELAGLVRSYRGGYLPEDRRAIEKALFSGSLLGVSSTNALELGIDIGSLQASIVVGFPSTIASLWQQSGRAGRGCEGAMTFFVAYDDPIDQYLMRHPEYLFSRTPESAVIDPENPYILSDHLQCAAFELPLREEDHGIFGGMAEDLIQILDRHGRTRNVNGESYWANTDFPARAVNLRHMSQDTYSIIEVEPDVEPGSAYRPETGPAFRPPERGGSRLMGTVDAISALELLYPEAVYLHEGESYVVRQLDLEAKTAYVERKEVDYYTTPVLDQAVRLRETREAHERDAAILGFGDVTVTWVTSFFKKIRFFSVDSIGYGILDLPHQDIDTTAFWIMPGAALTRAVRGAGMDPMEGMAGLRNLLVSVIPLYAMCDRADIGGVVDSGNLRRSAVFMYDRYPGGLGFVEHAFRRAERVLGACLDLVKDCPCGTGCPSCVGLPVLRPPQHQDPDVGRSWPLPNKETACVLLEGLIAGTATDPPVAEPTRARIGPGVEV